MSTENLRDVVVEALRSVAPETDPTTLPDDARLRDELDLDSMDFLNFVIAVHRAVHVEIPEADYPKLGTLGGAVRYLEARTSPA